MDFLTATILSGVVYDQFKKGGAITGNFIKDKLRNWIINDTTSEKIANTINEMPELYKKSEKILEGAIESDENLMDILNNIKSEHTYEQNNSNSTNNGYFVNGSGNSTGNTTNNYYGVFSQDNLQKINQDKICLSRDKLKWELDILLEENRGIFILYGPTERNKQDIFSEKPNIWKEMAKNIIIPNNKKIINLLEHNKELLNREERSILVNFKIHAKGFENNQNGEKHRAEYIQFPIEIVDILK